MKSQYSRRGFITAAGIAALSGCMDSSGRSPEEAAGSDTDPGTETGTETAPPLASRTLPISLSGEQLREEVVSGGPPTDGIPAIDGSQFLDAGSAGELLSDGDIIVGVSRGDVSRAYPQKIMVKHEIVNDVIGGDPVSVTYCPLTGTAQGLARGGTTTVSRVDSSTTT